MTATDPVAFFTVQLERATRGLDVARNGRNVQLAALNGRQIFKGRLMIGLARWRRGESPVADLQEAVQKVQDVAEMVRGWDSSFDGVTNLPIARAALIARLLGKGTADTYQSRVADSRVPAEVRLDLLLAEEMSGGEGTRAVAAAIADLSSDKRTALATASYENYFGILASSKDAAELARRAEQGNALFLRRARDSYYSGGEQTEGGGESNAEVVDYRLALALKAAKYQGASIHNWKW